MHANLLKRRRALEADARACVQLALAKVKLDASNTATKICANHSPPNVPKASVAATAQAKAVSTPVRIASERRRSSLTRRDDPSARGEMSERMTSGFDSDGSS